MEQQYIDEELSIGDIAQKYQCSRQNILKLLQRHGIPRRSKSHARSLALTKGKLSVTLVDATGQTREVLHVRRIVQADFFKVWTPAMAYVLGVIYTDGCLVKPCGPLKHRLRISQKEPELLEKVIALMGSNAKIGFSKARGIAGAVYYCEIDNAEIYADLLGLGLTPRKSLVLTFPDMPSEHVRHFIRGCWDGDGSVSWERNKPSRPRASYVSGSKVFVEEFVKHLGVLGLPDRTIYVSRRSKNPCYYLSFSGRDCGALYHVLYDGVDSSMYLSRKHERFTQVADHFERDGLEQIRDSPPSRRSKSTLSLSEQLRVARNAIKTEMDSYGSRPHSEASGNDDDHLA